MLRISKLTDYATLLLTHMARAPQQVYSARGLAEQAALPLPVAAKLLKLLAREGLLVSQRGAAGGYVLSRAPQRISMAQILAAVEGPLAVTECALGRGVCEMEKGCATRPHWQLIGHALQVALEAVNLADMVAPKAAPVRLQRLER